MRFLSLQCHFYFFWAYTDHYHPGTTLRAAPTCQIRSMEANKAAQNSTNDQCGSVSKPCTPVYSSHQNSWDSWMFIPLKMVLIGIDP